jgi:hypothetical protein
MNAVRIPALAAVAAAALAAACATAPGATDWDLELSGAEARWHAAAASNYTFRLLRTCACVANQTRPVTVTVRGGAFASLAFADSLGGTADTTLFRQYLTIERYFTLLHQVIASGPYTFSATYNQSLGFPLSVTVNPERMVTGDEFLVEIYAFTVDAP